jgi:NADH-quinone oxidoreductase subunit D
VIDLLKPESSVQEGAPAIPAPNGAGQPNFTVTPKTTAEGVVESDLLEVSMGPHHPSTHGVFRMDVVLDGERVVRLKPVFGYLHRNHEKIAENTTYLGSMPYTDRLDYFCSMTNNWAYALSVEKLTGLQPPERAEYLRVILAELTRLQNHACLV